VSSAATGLSHRGLVTPPPYRCGSLSTKLIRDARNEPFAGRYYVLLEDLHLRHDISMKMLQYIYDTSALCYLRLLFLPFLLLFCLIDSSSVLSPFHFDSLQVTRDISLLESAQTGIRARLEQTGALFVGG